MKPAYRSTDNRAERPTFRVRRLILAVVACLLVLLGSNPAAAQVVHQYTNSTDSAVDAISDTLTPCATPFERSFNVTDSFYISDVDIGVLMAHTYRGDLAMYLRGPDGTRVRLIQAIGASVDNVNTSFNDQAANPVANYTGASTATNTTVVPPYTGSFRPAQGLSAFNGKLSNGTWTLQICDEAAIDSGTFFQADLYLTDPPPAYADLSLVKTVNNSLVPTGASVSYTLTVTNASNSTATASGVTVRDLLPAGLTFVSSSGTGTYVSGTGVWTVGSLAPNASASLTINATVTAAKGTTINNTAQITASSVTDLDSTPNNSVTTEDDYSAAPVTVVARFAGTPPVLSCANGSTVFDWDTKTWNAGSVSNSYPITAVGNLGFALTNPGAWVNNATYGGLSPTRQNVATGGVIPAQYSLMLMTDQANQTAVATTTITLGTGVAGVQFRIFDIDFLTAQYADKITVSGSLNGTAVAPTLTNGMANYVTGNTVIGDDAAGDTEANGNVVVTFAAPVDTIVISFGNHTTAPANPGQQTMQIHDMTLCLLPGQMSSAKTSVVISDPFNGTTNPKMIPGATLEYCVLITNTGVPTATSVVASDALPANETYVASSSRSGTTCANATTVEDDNATGADDTDAVGVSFASGTLSTSSASLAGGGTIAIKFQATIN